MSKGKTAYNIAIWVFLCLVWSTTWAMIKIGLDDTPPLVGLALRFTIASAVLFPAVFISGRKIPMDRASLKLYGLVGFFNMALGYFCTYWGTLYIPSSLSAILWATLPVCIGLFAHFLVKAERLNTIRTIAIFISLLGVFGILSDQKLVFSWSVFFGCLVVLSGVMVSAYPTVYAKNRTFVYDPLVLTAMSIGIAAACHALAATVFGEWSEMVWDIKNIGSAAYLGIFGSAIAFFGYYTLLTRIAVIKLSFITFITPIFATAIGWFFLGELITVKEIIGVLLIFLGLFIYDLKGFRRLIAVKQS